MDVKLVERKSYNPCCFGCHKEIKEGQQSYYDDEDYWHKECYDNFIDRLKKANRFKVSSILKK